MLSPTKREGAGAPETTARFEPVAGMVVAEKYRVERLLGEGGMGIVVGATHLGLDQRVAIKFLLPEAMGDRDAVERFQREAKVAAMIRSDYVARVHDVGSMKDGVPYIVMEYLEGNDLGDLIGLQGPLPIEEACEMALQACEALAEVHAAGIVHRDLKPSNLFVTRRADGSPVIKVLDFGISKLSTPAADNPDPALTATATIMGSPSYMSPEQLKSTKEVDARTDVWALGAVLYEAVTGKPAFRGESVPQVCAMIASEEPVPPSTLREGIPPELDRAILGCLVKKPDARLSLVDLARALAALAPERAMGLLERIEATVGDVEPRPAAPPRAVAGRSGEATAAPLTAASRPTRVAVTAKGERRDRRRGGLVVLLVLVAGGALGLGVYAGHVGDIRPRGWQGKLAGATSAVTSAASAVTSVAGAVSSAVASAVASSLPEEPAPSASAGPAASASDEADDNPQPAPHAAMPGHSAQKPAAPAKPHPFKPHHAAKPWHRH